MKIRLNLATSPLENHRRFLLGATVTGAVGLALLGLFSVKLYANWDGNRKVRTETSKLQRELSDFRNQRRDLEEFFSSAYAKNVMDRAAFLNGLIRQRSFPWTRIFKDLEEGLPPGVRVISISPRMQNERVEVKLVVGARSDENKILFIKKLEESPAFSRVQLVSETRPQHGAEDQLTLEVVAWYRSVAPAEAAPAPAVAASQPGGKN
jgi:Tfp pilus assembly protein PilN